MRGTLLIKLTYESLKMAFQALVSNKLRSFLSVLGIMIGIFCIIMIYTIVDSLEINIKDSFKSLGTNVIYADKFVWQDDGESGYPWWKYINRPAPSPDDVEYLKKHPVNDLISAIAYKTQLSGSKAKAGKNSIDNFIVVGASFDLDKIQELQIENGRYFNEMESEKGRNVVIIGHTIAENLFPDGNALGKEMEVFHKKVTIIGIFKYEGDNLISINFDDKILMPVNFMRQIMPLDNDAMMEQNVIIKAKEGVSLDYLKSELTGAYRSMHRLRPAQEDDFALNKITILEDTLSEFFGSLQKFGFIIGMFSLLVGGFGVANIMFVSVKERTNLIGIQKSLGAKTHFILIQFLTEAVVLTIIGGLVGIALAYIASYGGNYLLKNMVESNFRLVMTASNFILGVSISALIGLIAGIIPAIAASKLQPVEAIRSK